jgi:hypothetical protein
LNLAFNQAIGDLLTKLQVSQRQLASYRHFLNDLIEKEKEVGFVLDPRDKENVILHLSEAYPLQAGDKAMVFRQDDEWIAELAFYKEGNALKSKISRLSEGKFPRPMDKLILIKKQTPQ